MTSRRIRKMSQAPAVRSSSRTTEKVRKHWIRLNSDPDNFDPNDGPKFRRGGNGAKGAFWVLYLLGDNYESKRKYLSKKLDLENNSNKSEVDEQQSKVYIEEYRDKDEEINED